MVKVVLWMLIGTVVLIALFVGGSSTKPKPAPVDEEAEAARMRQRDEARVAAAVSAAVLKEKQRAVELLRQRAELRENIYRGLGKQPSEMTAKGPAKRTLPRSSPVPLDKKYIQERIREEFVPLAKSCYDGVLVRDPTARGKAVFSFVIVGDAETGGIVESAELVQGTTLSDPDFAYCVNQSLMSVSFDPPPNDGWVTVTYPMDFSPDEPSDDDEGASESGKSTAPASKAAKQPRTYRAQISDVTASGVSATDRGRLSSFLGSSMESCYSKESKSNPDARGTLTLSMNLDKDGDVTYVDARTSSIGSKSGSLGSSLVDCAKSAARRMKLRDVKPRDPKSMEKARVSVTVRFTYSPE